MKKFNIFALLLIILLGAFAVRLYRFDAPVADWQSWRQADTSAVSRNFIKYGFDVLHPRFDDLSNGVSLLDNPLGYRFVEFPVYNLLQAGLFKTFGYFTIEQWGRLVTIFSSQATIIFLYLIVKKYISTRASLFAAFFYAFVPYSIYYGRVILPDQLMVATMLGGIYFFDKWLDEKNFQFSIFNFQFSLAVILIASSVLVKPYVLFFALPLVYLTWIKFGFGMLKKKELWIFLMLSLLPFILWRIWMQQYPEGIPRNDWLFNGNGIRFKGAFFHWIFAERISHLILGFFGLPFVIIGLLAKVKKEGWFFSLFVVSSLLYVTDIATGNVQHDYYQILIVPTLAIFFAKGIDFSFTKAGDLFHRYTTYFVIFVSISFMLSFGWFKIRDYYSIQHPEIVATGLAVDKLLPKEAKIVVPYNGDTAFLYQTNRHGWPVVERSFQELIKAGAQYMVFAYPTKEELHLENDFAILKKTEMYVIFDLTKPLRPIK